MQACPLRKPEVMVPMQAQELRTDRSRFPRHNIRQPPQLPGQADAGDWLAAPRISGARLAKDPRHKLFARPASQFAVPLWSLRARVQRQSSTSILEPADTDHKA